MEGLAEGVILFGLADAIAASSSAYLAALSSFTLAAFSSQHCFSCAGRLRHCQH